MYSQSDIEDAVAGGALTAEQAASLRSHVAARTGTPTADEEHTRILLGFNDLYVFYASIFLLIGVGWVGYKIGAEGGDSPFIGLLVTAGAWGLAELFARRRRQALPGITYATTVVYGAFATVILAAGSILGWPAIAEDTGALKAVFSLLGAGAAFLYWLRFKEPITISLGVGMVALAIMFLVGAAVPSAPDGKVGDIVLLILGLAIFVYAMSWDGKDRRRETANADIGLWLHLSSAWMVIFALASLLGLSEGIVSTGTSILSIVLFILFAAVALAVSRRIWALAAAYPLGVGIYNLIRGNPESAYLYGDPYGSPYGGYSGGGASTTDHMMITLLIIGILLVLIAQFWTPIRRALVGALPAGLQARVPATGRTDAEEAKSFE